MSRGLLIRNNSAFTSSRPVSTSNASARSEISRCPIAAVNQTRPSATTGDDHPRPGIGVFQTTFRDSLQSLGRPCSSEWPCPSGPLNCGQSWASITVAAEATHMKIDTTNAGILKDRCCR